MANYLKSPQQSSREARSDGARKLTRATVLMSNDLCSADSLPAATSKHMK
jgi:hypothetical protein